MTIQQRLLFGLAAVVLLILVLELVRRRRLREEYTVFWLLTCAVLVVLALWKGGLAFVAQLLGTTLPLSALFGAGFFLVFLIMLHFSTVASDLWHQNKHMAKEIALLEEELGNLRRQIKVGGENKASIEAKDCACSDTEPSLRS
jgi:hypothetical protein